MGVMIPCTTTVLQMTVSPSLFHLRRLCKDQACHGWSVLTNVLQQFGQYEYYTAAIPSLEVWIYSEIPIQLFKPTEIVSVAQRLLLVFVIIGISFSLTSNSFLPCYFFFSHLHEDFCFPNTPIKEITFVTDVTLKILPLYLLLLVCECSTCYRCASLAQERSAKELLKGKLQCR